MLESRVFFPPVRVTKYFAKPWDGDLARAMVRTLGDLMREFCSGLVTGFTESDEISLVFRRPVGKDSHHTLLGRTQKLASLVAGVCSVRFNRHLEELLREVGFPMLVFVGR